ncbi:MAG: ABC transporter substrate-binding protein [Candidatus Nucleicultricaceae bacterium]
MKCSKTLTLLSILHFCCAAPYLAATSSSNLSLPSLQDFKNFNDQKVHDAKSNGVSYKIGNYVNDVFSFVKRIFEQDVVLDNSDFICKLLDNYKTNSSSNPHLSITPSSGDQLLVWGNLEGEIQPLLYCLQYLKEKNIIDENLNIQGNKIKFVFLGNVIDRSKNTLPMLKLILTLFLKNPGKVFFLKGENENEVKEIYNSYSRHTLKKQSHYMKDALLSREIVQFLSNLPETLTLYTPHDQKSILLSGKTFPLAASIDVNESKNFLDSASQPITDFPLIRLQNVDRKKSYNEPHGLDELAQFEGATTWNISSCSLDVYKKLYGTTLEAFGVIDISDDLYQSTVTLYARNQETLDLFKTKKYSLLTGASIDSGFEKTKGAGQPIFLGSSMDLTEGSSTFGKRVLYGTDLKIREQNRIGGIQGNTLHAFYSNDKYLPSLALSNAKHYVEDAGIHLILSPLGAPTGSSMLSYAKDGRAAILFPVSGSPVFRQPNLGTVVNYRASYDDEIKALLHYARKTLLKQKFAIFYNSNRTGQLLGDKAKEILLNEHGMDPESICQAKIPPNSLDVSQAAKKIEEFDPDVILFLASYSSSRALVNKIGVQFLSNVTLMGYSFITDRFKQFVGGSSRQEEGLGLEFVIARVVPNPKTSKLEIVREYREHMNQEYPGAIYDTDSLEAYINASILIKVLKSLNPPYTPEKVVSYIKGLRDFQFKGLHLTYDEKIFGFSKDIWLDLGEGEWKHYDVATESFISE